MGLPSWHEFLIPVTAGMVGREPEKSKGDFGWVLHSLAQLYPTFKGIRQSVLKGLPPSGRNI